MAKFKIQWSSGKEETVDQSDCSSVEQLVNCRFGRGFDTEANGVEVVLVEDKEPVKEPAKEPVKEPVKTASTTKAKK